MEVYSSSYTLTEAVNLEGSLLAILFMFFCSSQIVRSFNTSFAQNSYPLNYLLNFFLKHILINNYS